MAMKNPPHPGRGLRDDIEALKLTVAEAAEALGVTRQQLYNVINGKSAITPEMALRLEQGIGGTAESWIRLQSSYDLAQARLKASQIKVRKLAPRVA